MGDNVRDYLSFVVILICIGITEIFWTYKPRAVNYCTFCCGGYRKYTDKELPGWNYHHTLAFACCPYLLENADRKRLSGQPKRHIETVAGQRRTDSTGAMLSVQGKGQDVVEDRLDTMFMGTGRMFSITNLSTSDGQLVDILESGKSIKAIVMDFDGVLTMEKSWYFEYWAADDVARLQMGSLLDLFGGQQRIDQLRGYLSRCQQKQVELICLGQDPEAKLQSVLQSISIAQFFTEIIGSDHELIKFEPERHNRAQILMLRLIESKSMDNEEVLYVCADEDNCSRMASNGTCFTYLPGSLLHNEKKDPKQNTVTFGITKNDFQVIEKTI